jgi:hypothetical protein
MQQALWTPFPAGKREAKMNKEVMRKPKRGKWGYLGAGIVILIIGINLHYSNLSVRVSQNCQSIPDGSVRCLVQLTNVSGTTGSLLIRSTDLYWQAVTSSNGVNIEPFHGYLSQGDTSETITITAAPGSCPFQVAFQNNDDSVLAHLDYTDCGNQPGGQR